MKYIKSVSVVLVILTLVLVTLPTAFAGPSVQVNINTATKEQLMQLKGVGDKYAQRIIDYRKTKGSFAKPEDIINVPGIGQKIWEANKDLIVVTVKQPTPKNP